MTLSIFRRTPPTPGRQPRATRRAFALESLEDRLVMSHAAVVPAALPAVHVAPTATSSVSVPVSITGVNLTGLTQSATGLITGLTGTVTGTLAGQSFTAPLTVSSATTTGVPVLDLDLGPIDLNVLGLEVKTSEICLDITAQPGPGNLLGNLVAGLANALNGAAPTTPAGVTSLLNSVTSQLTTVTTGAAGTGSSSVLGLLDSGVSSALGSLTAASTTGATNLVHLSVGPLNLNLLGLVVNLDNCAGGPVTVDVNAIPGAGNLLGNLLGGLAHILDTPSQHLGLLGRLDNAIIAAIGQL